MIDVCFVSRTTRRETLCAHMGDAVHLGVDPLWSGCKSTVGGIRWGWTSIRLCENAYVLRPVRREVWVPTHSVRRSTGQRPTPSFTPNVLFLGERELAEMVDVKGGFVHVLVITEDLSGYFWLRASKTFRTSFVASELVTWCNTFGNPPVEG